MNRFDQIQGLLGLTEKEKSQILSINQSNDPSRRYKEVWIGLGGTQSGGVRHGGVHARVPRLHDGGKRKRWKSANWRRNWAATWKPPYGR